MVEAYFIAWFSAILFFAPCTQIFGQLCLIAFRRAIVGEINDVMAQKSPVKAVLSGDKLAYKLGKYSLRKVDMVALVVLPSIFLVFNVAYWAHYSIMLQGGGSHSAFG